MNKAALNICIPVFLWHTFLLFLNNRSGIAQLCGKYMFEFIRNYHSVFQMDHRLKHKSYNYENSIKKIGESLHNLRVDKDC